MAETRDPAALAARAFEPAGLPTASHRAPDATAPSSALMGIIPKLPRSSWTKRRPMSSSSARSRSLKASRNVLRLERTRIVFSLRRARPCPERFKRSATRTAVCSVALVRLTQGFGQTTSAALQPSGVRAEMLRMKVEPSLRQRLRCSDEQHRYAAL
jgi:hypothetical protein